MEHGGGMWGKSELWREAAVWKPRGMTGGGPAVRGKESEWKCSGRVVLGVRFPQRVLPTPADLGCELELGPGLGPRRGLQVVVRRYTKNSLRQPKPSRWEVIPRRPALL